MRRGTAIAAVLVLGLFVAGAALPGLAVSEKSKRDKAAKLYKDGNYAEAFGLYKDLATNSRSDPDQVPADLTMGVSCLQTLNRVHETDAFREAVIAAHPDNWKLLFSAAQSYFGGTHYGYIVAGEFHRGPHRGGGRYVNALERDRVRALQLMDQAVRIIEKRPDDKYSSNLRAQLNGFYLTFARMLMGYRGYAEAWRLQYLSDLAELPDYEEGYGYYGTGTRGAPVDAEGNPVFHHTPDSYKAAQTDGERWRWFLHRAMTVYPQGAEAVKRDFANFLYQQFGVQTLAWYGRNAFGYGATKEEQDEDESGPYALHTLGEDETIAQLATGIKRFKLPDDANFIRLYEELKDWHTLGQLFENRRQYPRAVEFWKKAGPGYEQRVRQIVGNWGLFQPVGVHAAGQPATVDFRFRNATKVRFQAYEVHVDRLLADVKTYLKSNPRTLDWNRMNLSNVGYQVVNQDEKRYRGKRVAKWEMNLKPGKNHFDRVVTVKTPLETAGVYLLTARLDDGNVSRILVWLDDTAIVKKQLDQKAYVWVGDAVNGKALPETQVEFFGYRQEYVGSKWPRKRQYEVHTRQFKRQTDKDGQVILKPGELSDDYQWVITVQDKGRLAYLGFTGFWYSNYYDYEYNQTKVFTITDRPVYRPDQSVHWKFWVRHARYDMKDESTFAGRTFTVRITNPRGEKVYEGQHTADDWGGLEGDYSLPSEATLGVYYLQILHHGGGSFRVEEYKKPEFEVTVDAPREPIMLGEKITAKVKAKYYFGAPVTNATVKYKVLRNAHTARWYPVALWDWFYGAGYWWFAYDYSWWPGWSLWGHERPRWWWWPTSYTPPEIVSEGEVRIGADGTIEVPIDTGVAKALHGDTDHRYDITAEVRDESRRTIVGVGSVLVARRPFKVYAWVNRGHFRVGETVHAHFSAQTLDHKPVQGSGELTLYRVSYADGKPRETAVQSWSLPTNTQGRAEQQLKASRAGQYRLSYLVTDKAGHEIEGGYVFVVRGEGFDGADYRFNELELVPDKKEYKPGENVRLMVNTNREGATVVLFLRPANGIYLPPVYLHMKGKSAVHEVPVTKKDMPNFFVEAFTVYNGEVFTDTREIVVPPEKRVLNVEVKPDADKYKPGQEAQVRVKLTDLQGNPYQGSLVLAVFDKSVEYISGGTNVPEIKSFFWKWRRQHSPRTEHSLQRRFGNLLKSGEAAMAYLGVFGHLTLADGVEQEKLDISADNAVTGGGGAGLVGRAAPAAPVSRSGGRKAMKKAEEAPARERVQYDFADETIEGELQRPGDADQAPAGVEPTVRSKFADTAFWAGALTTDAEGIATVRFDMPENLTGWKLKTWAMGHGTRVGEGEASVVTVKNLLLRMQAPRFFVEKDEVVLSANIHNYLDSAKEVTAVLELDGNTLEPMDERQRTLTIEAGGEKRVDWRVKVVREGEATIRMKALSDEESDAMEMKFPVFVHGMLKTESFSGVIRPEGKQAAVELSVPRERRPEQTRLEVRYSPTLAGAMVDALPYLVSYPYGCTEQTLSRFLPTVITQKVLKEMGVDLADVKAKRTNLNAQEIGDDKERARQWQRYDHNPVFDEDEVNRMVTAGMRRLYSMQVSDGGWGWFSGWGERSYPHTTAYVVHGLQIAAQNGVDVDGNVLSRGVSWLERYQAEQVRLIKRAPKKKRPYKEYADNLDAFIYMVLADAGRQNKEMREFLYRDRTKLAVYAMAMYGMALHKQDHAKKLAMVMRNISQYLVVDDENQTAWLNLGNSGYWWYWYGSEYEAHAYYLKLLALTDPKSHVAAGLVKYLLNNRKHATYWKSTRDTAVCVEAMADYLRASGESKPDMTLDVYVDGERRKRVHITSENLFTFDNKLVLEGMALDSGKHTLELRREGQGPVYFNAYLTNFTLEDFIEKAGLEIKVQRRYYKLEKVDKTIKVSGARGQALDQKVEKYERVPIKNWDTLVSGDLVEIELEIDSKNDYEYIVFEDMKAAGFEPVQVRSGYSDNNGLWAYREFRDEKVAFFVRALARGKHSMSYRMRAEIPGRFSALPTKGYAMYAPELKANSDELKVKITD